MYYAADVSSIARQHGLRVSDSMRGNIVERGDVIGGWALAVDGDGEYYLTSYDATAGAEVVEDLYTDDLSDALAELAGLDQSYQLAN